MDFENPKPGDIIEFNSTIFSGMMHDWGCETKVYPVASDKAEVIINLLKTAIAECDLVLLNAGSSAGQKDFSIEAIQTVVQSSFMAWRSNLESQPFLG